MVGDGTELPINHVGHANFPPTDIGSKSLALRNILLIPSITKCLISISKFTVDNNMLVEFAPYCLVKDIHKNTMLLRGTLTDGLYQLQVPSMSSTTSIPTLETNCHPTWTSLSCSTTVLLPECLGTSCSQQTLIEACKTWSPQCYSP